jgi:hypothetical protein
MAFENLREEIEEMFRGFQDSEDVRRETVFHRADEGRESLRGGHVNIGFRTFCPNPPPSDHRKACLRRYERDHAERVIRERLLAGDRPKGGRGRPPTRWKKIAAELGIDLGLPAPEAARG